MCAFSRGSPPLIKMPYRAPIPVPTITAVGVANPKAHGQAMTKTEIAKLKDKVVADISLGTCTRFNRLNGSQTINVMIAIVTITGTNTFEIRSKS